MEPKYFCVLSEACYDNYTKYTAHEFQTPEEAAAFEMGIRYGNDEISCGGVYYVATAEEAIAEAKKP